MQAGIWGKFDEETKYKLAAARFGLEVGRAYR